MQKGDEVTILKVRRWGESGKHQVGDVGLVQEVLRNPKTGAVAAVKVTAHNESYYYGRDDVAPARLLLLAHPETTEVLALSTYSQTLYQLDGTPTAAPEDVLEWKQVGAAPTLYAWQQDPGFYGPAYVIARLYRPMEPLTTHGEVYVANGSEYAFTAGGSLLAVLGYCEDRGFVCGRRAVEIRHVYASRNHVRDTADLAL